MKIVRSDTLNQKDRNIVVGCIDDSMRLSRRRLDGLACVDRRRRRGLAREDRDGAAHDVKRIPHLAVKVPWHLFSRREDHVIDLHPRRSKTPMRRP